MMNETRASRAAQSERRHELGVWKKKGVREGVGLIRRGF
jgi:hypothetical protein